MRAAIGLLQQRGLHIDIGEFLNQASQFRLPVQLDFRVPLGHPHGPMTTSWSWRFLQTKNWFR